ncbi:molybdenum cofactor guanylyltransferase [Planctomycetota bacterium]
MPRWPHTAAILCGGGSQRMGRPKAGIILPDGLTIIEHVYHALEPLCDKVILAGQGESVPESLSHLQRIEDNTPGLGPLGGIESLLDSSIDLEYLITPCDLFRATPELFALLLQPGIKAPAVLATQKSGQLLLEAAIARYSTTDLGIVRQLIEEQKFKLRTLAERTAAQTITVPEELWPALANANTPEDLT